MTVEMSYTLDDVRVCLDGMGISFNENGSGIFVYLRRNGLYYPNDNDVYIIEFRYTDFDHSVTMTARGKYSEISERIDNNEWIYYNILTDQYASAKPRGSDSDPFVPYNYPPPAYTPPVSVPDNPGEYHNGYNDAKPVWDRDNLFYNGDVPPASTSDHHGEYRNPAAYDPYSRYSIPSAYDPPPPWTPPVPAYDPYSRYSQYTGAKLSSANRPHMVLLSALERLCDVL